MFKTLLRNFVVLALLSAPCWAGVPREKQEGAHRNREQITQISELWRSPGDIRGRDLFYGNGGKEHAPHTVYTFIKEDMNGTNPKIRVRDEQGVKWRVKLGVEARPETVASRLVWAVGYSTNEFYFLPEMRVEGLPARLRRGQNLVLPGGVLRNVDLKRLDDGDKKVGIWRWRDNPFLGTREFNGLRVMMALINNWDLKDDNNAIYKMVNGGSKEESFRVSDLGASFGSSGPSWTPAMAKGNLQSYERSKFIGKVTSHDVDFDFPTRPALKYLFDPPALIEHLRMRWIGRRVPRADARWIGGLLSELSEDQIRDAFRAGGYNSKQVDAYARLVVERIHQLNGL